MSTHKQTFLHIHPRWNYTCSNGFKSFISKLCSDKRQTLCKRLFLLMEASAQSSVSATAAQQALWFPGNRQNHWLISVGSYQSHNASWRFILVHARRTEMDMINGILCRKLFCVLALWEVNTELPNGAEVSSINLLSLYPQNCHIIL